MITALELLKILKADIPEDIYSKLKNELEEEIFKDEFEDAFKTPFIYDLGELRAATDNYVKGQKDKVYFIKNIYEREALVNFLNKYWDRMDQIILLVIERLNKIDQEKEQKETSN